MNGEAITKMIEELVDLKFQQHIETTLKHSPEVAKILQAKRETDQQYVWNKSELNWRA